MNVSVNYYIGARAGKYDLPDSLTPNKKNVFEKKELLLIRAELFFLKVRERKGAKKGKYKPKSVFHFFLKSPFENIN